MEPSKDPKIKLLNDKLNALMQKKGITLPSKPIVKELIQKTQEKSDEKQQKEKIQVIEETEKQKRMEKTKPIKKQQKGDKNLTLRKAAGLVWEDKSLIDWPENDYRIFVGNLGKEATDQILTTVFKARYPSFNMAKVVQDKRTGRPKGYGFVSFSQPRDFLNAIKEMNGQYIGNRPAKVIKSNWKDRNLDSARNQMLPSDFKTNAKKETNKIYTDFKYVHPY